MKLRINETILTESRGLSFDAIKKLRSHGFTVNSLGDFSYLYGYDINDDYFEIYKTLNNCQLIATNEDVKDKYITVGWYTIEWYPNKDRTDEYISLGYDEEVSIDYIISKANTKLYEVNNLQSIEEVKAYAKNNGFSLYTNV